MPSRPINGRACVCDYESFVHFFASNWGGVWRLAGDMIAPSKPSHCLIHRTTLIELALPPGTLWLGTLALLLSNERYLR